ncbi:S-layer homology domain-containing protein [Candidatus Avoscillospira sp. LCP25S3_F1]|uniref:S-layer homology domain-containing protein n=1 Tax=Candidatus Avoscillospira sp. LCP25S3_F1 TaxID=3438825 RepID=UPI003F93B80B
MKIRNTSAKIAWNVWSILLCLVMVLGMLPTAALAADDTEYPEAGKVSIADNGIASIVTLQTISLPLEAKVQQGGMLESFVETFEFELVDTAEVPQDLSYYGISLLDHLKIEINGKGTFTKTVDFMVEMGNFAANHWRAVTPAGSDEVHWYAKTFLIQQSNPPKFGWEYSTTKYALTFWYDVKTKNLELEIHVPGNDVYFDKASFTNTYTCNEIGYTVSFKKTVKLGGSAAPDRQVFALEIFDPGVSSMTDFEDLYTATVTTDGEGSYMGTLDIFGPVDQVEALICEGFYVRERHTGAENWTYSDAVWHMVPVWDTDGWFLTFYPTTLERLENGDVYYKDAKYPEDTMIFENIYTRDSAANPFTDVPGDSYYADAVLWAVDKGITAGTGAATFDPDGICTRAQAVTFLWRAAGSPAPKAASMPFADVPAGSWYYDAVLWAVEQGITAGTSATTFSPDRNCSRAQIVSFLYRAAGSPAVSGSPTFSDVAPGAYYAKAVQWAETKGITGGIGGGLFGSDNNCTRAQIVTFIYRSAF